MCRDGGWATWRGSGYNGWNFTQAGGSVLPPLGKWSTDRADAETPVSYAASFLELVPYDDAIHRRQKLSRSPVGEEEALLERAQPCQGIQLRSRLVTTLPVVF